MPKRIVILLGLIGFLLVGIMVLWFRAKSQPEEIVNFDERAGCKYPGRLVSVDDAGEFFTIEYNSECSLCSCNEERGLSCQVIECLDDFREGENEE